MNEIFNPTLVISIGPSAKKALEYLKAMLRDVPDYLYDVIELCEVNHIENAENKIQKIIDDKLLNAKKINRLVDIGYKIRTETTASIKINIYVYWDLYEANFPMAQLIEGLLHLNYGMVDKTKHSGVCLFLLPMLDKEWGYDGKVSQEKVSELKAVREILCKKENMINMDSKVYLTHTIARDGLRIPKNELEYIIAMITYLTILPSESPLLSTYSKRLIMHEKDFKIGTLGISTLTVFKERLKEEFAENLSRDIIDYGCNHLEEVDYNIYSSLNLIEGKNISNVLSTNIPLNLSNEEMLLVTEKYKIQMGNEGLLDRQPETYIERLHNTESRLNKEFIEPLKENIEKKKVELIDETKLKINTDLNSVVLTYSLIQGKGYLEELRRKVKKQSVNFQAEMVERDENIKDELLSKIERYPNFIGFWFKFFIIFLFLFDTILSVQGKITTVSTAMKVVIITIFLLFVVAITAMEYLYQDKSFVKFIKKYIDNIYINGAATLKKKVAEEVLNYYEDIISYIEEEIKAIDEIISSFTNYKVYSGDFNEDEENYDEILINDLLSSEDRKSFYHSSEKDIKHIYTKYVGRLPTYEVLKDPSQERLLKEFSSDIAVEYVNIDFYDYAKFKWKDNFKVEAGQWIDKAIVKSKELLQYNEDYNLEGQKIFVGSKDFMDECKETIASNLNGYKMLSIEGKDIHTNCISIINLTLGIDLDKITPFVYNETPSPCTQRSKLELTKYKFGHSLKGEGEEK